MYFTGVGVDKNLRLAAKWYKRSAKSKYAPAQYNLGLMYYKGQGLTLNYKKAAFWFKKAAENGYSIAQYKLGILYYYGKGVPINQLASLLFFNISLNNGFEPAKNNISFLASKRPYVEIKMIQDLTDEWFKAQDVEIILSKLPKQTTRM